MRFICLYFHATIPSFLTASFILFLSVLFQPSAQAQSLQNFVNDAVQNHNLVKAAQAKLKAAVQRAKASGKDWYPTLNLNSSAGHEKLRKPSTTSSERFHSTTIGLSQKLWDFGDTKAKMTKADLKLQKAELKLYTSQQDIMLKALSAILEHRKTSKILKFAHKSEDNIKTQTGMEEIMVRAGSGYTTDVLQAKTQLAGAAARRISARLGVNAAISRYRIVFPNMPSPKQLGYHITLPERFLPQALAMAEKIAKQNNPDLLLSRLDAQISEQTIAQTRAEEFAPKITLKVEQKWKHNVGGLRGDQEETLGKIEFNMPLNLGLTGLNEINAAQSDEEAAHFKVEDRYSTMLDKVRQAWYQLKSSRQLYEARKEQASIAKAFLDLARKERKLGKRSLIDVLSGETSLINAQSDAVAARVDLTISGYTLLSVMGILKIDHITTH